MNSLVSRSCLMALVIASAAPALAASFSDEPTFRAAAGSLGLDTFESYAPGTQVHDSLFLGVTFALLNDAATYPSAQPVGSTGGYSVSGTMNLLNDLDFELPGRGPIGFGPTVAGTAMYAVGYWNTGGDDGTRLSLYDINDVLIEAATVGPEDGPHFVGIVTSTPAYRAEISEFGGNGYFLVDDLQVSLHPAPEPASLALLGIGAVPFLLRRRRLA
jgi:hypothetical protein